MKEGKQTQQDDIVDHQVDVQDVARVHVENLQGRTQVIRKQRERVEIVPIIVLE